ncbi:MAG TPA: hypothetical protein VF314_10265 [Actinomycetes bacterium]
MITLDLARAHIRDLQREADRDRAGSPARQAPSPRRLRRLVSRHRDGR